MNIFLLILFCVWRYSVKNLMCLSIEIARIRPWDYRISSYMQRGIHKVCGFDARMCRRARSTGYPALRFLTKARLYSLEDKGLARVSGTDCTALSTDRTMNFVYLKKRKEIPLRKSQTPRKTSVTFCKLMDKNVLNCSNFYVYTYKFYIHTYVYTFF